MLEMLIHFLFRDGQALGQFLGGVVLLLEQLLEGLAYGDHKMTDDNVALNFWASGKKAALPQARYL
jgi:hypothetical protein